MFQDLLFRLREDITGLVRSEIDLAKAEVIEKVKVHARAAAFIAFALALVMLALLALLFSGIAALALAVPFWASALIIGVALLLVAALIGWLAVRSAQRAGLPVPEEAVAEALATVETLKEEAGIT
jgi:uncharacterized membrane protein YidH (DUF202 family)